MTREQGYDALDLRVVSIRVGTKEREGRTWNKMPEADRYVLERLQLGIGVSLHGKVVIDNIC
jgi:hypothetical protein